MPERSPENPLIPHARMRELYETMVGARLAGAALRLRGGRALGPKLEATWVGTGIALRDAAEDRFSAGETGPAIDLIAGLPAKAALAGGRSPQRMEMPGSALERVIFALGAAAGRREHIMLIYTRAGELSSPEWKRVLAEALGMELPVVFVVVPARKVEPGIAELSSRAGVPGIPVDAADAIGMVRVAQESLGRARAGGGPALIEAVRFSDAGDPVALLGRQLLARRIVTERWLAGVTGRLQRRFPTAD